MGYRKVLLMNHGYYHVYSKSIAEFEILRFQEEYSRLLEVIRFYRTAMAGKSYSMALKKESGACDSSVHGPERVKVIAYCLMPTHVHILLQQKSDDGISDFMRFILGSYASYFNIKTRRKGPLWERRFGARHVTTDSDLLHMTRYIHLNPTSAGLVANPEDWKFSSYHEYLDCERGELLCDFKHIIQLSPAKYKQFTEDGADYQRNLQIIKSYLLD